MAVDTEFADASPEKRLFISLLTRDISLIAAFLDLIDNSVNAAVEPYADRLKDSLSVAELLSDPTPIEKVNIDILINENGVKISDNAGGIQFDTARDHVFKFGRAEDETGHSSDRLSVYGIGLKRALFKLGRKIEISSDHKDGGFSLELDVPSWARDPDPKWRFPIKRRDASPATTGTVIHAKELNAETSRRIRDGLFIAQLREQISQTYSFFLSKFVNINVNLQPITVLKLEVSSNSARGSFELDGVSCLIVAGLVDKNRDERYKAEESGWYIYCNGRAVISADKSKLTGWGVKTAFPSFQPKHRAFLGLVFFVSTNAEALPWTTTKSGINEDSLVWQEAKRRMAALGKEVIGFLDKRYSQHGTELPLAALRRVGGSPINVLQVATLPTTQFEIPLKAAPETVKIQYSVTTEELRLVEDYIRQPNAGGEVVGKYTFYYFLRNQVGES